MSLAQSPTRPQASQDRVLSPEAAVGAANEAADTDSAIAGVQRADLQAHTRRAIITSALLFVASVIVAVAIIRFNMTWTSAMWIAICVVPATAIALIIAHLVAHDSSRIRSLPHRFALASVLTLGPIAAAGYAATEMMFVETADAIVGGSVLLVAMVTGARISYLLSSDVTRNVGVLRRGLAQVATGDRSVAFAVNSRDELSVLAAQARETVTMLAAEEARRDEAERMRREMVASISHDLRTPITSLRLLAEAISDDLVDEDTVKRYAASMKTSVETLGALIDDLFELARIEAGALTWSMRQFEFGEVVESVIGSMEIEAAQRGIRIVADQPVDSTEFVGDPARLRRVMLNLLQNAVRHTPEDGSITVRIEPGQSGGLEVEVADSGEGIDVEDRERIFEPFYRGGSEAARTRPGTGLGLAIARAIVEAHGGRIWLADPGAEAGSRFRFSLQPGSISAA